MKAVCYEDAVSHCEDGTASQARHQPGNGDRGVHKTNLKPVSYTHLDVYKRQD